jgi:GDP-L-fucose synthase
MKILVTGGSGFIGRNLVEHLQESHEVLAPTHAELELTDDQAVRAWFAQHEVDVVVHGAVRPGHRAAVDPSRQLWSNLRMFFNLMACGDRFRRLVFLSSGAVYDIRRPLRHAKEEELGASIPEDEHGLSKYVIGSYLDTRPPWAVPEVVELRLFGVFGRYEDYGIRFISNAVCKCLFDLPITLRQNRTFSYLYVDDLGPVVERFLEGPHVHAAYNVAPPWTDDLRDLALTVRRRSGKELPVAVAAPGEGRPYSASGERLAAEFPGIRFTPTERAVDELYSWYEARRDTIDRDVLLFDK